MRVLVSIVCALGIGVLLSGCGDGNQSSPVKDPANILELKVAPIPLTSEVAQKITNFQEEYKKNQKPVKGKFEKEEDFQKRKKSGVRSLSNKFFESDMAKKIYIINTPFSTNFAYHPDSELLKLTLDEELRKQLIEVPPCIAMTDTSNIPEIDFAGILKKGNDLNIKQWLTQVKFTVPEAKQLKESLGGSFNGKGLGLKIWAVLSPDEHYGVQWTVVKVFIYKNQK